MSIILVLNITAMATGKPRMPPINYVPLWEDPIHNLSMVLLPAITVGYASPEKGASVGLARSFVAAPIGTFSDSARQMQHVSIASHRQRRDRESMARLVPDNVVGLSHELPSLPSRQAVLLG